MTVETILLLGVVLSMAYCGVALGCAVRWTREQSGVRTRRSPKRCAHQAVTFFRPLKGGVRAVREKMETLVAAMGAEDQLLIGVDRESEEARIAEGVRAAFPQRDIGVVRCGREAAVNPKIAKLVQMAPHARHEDWIVADSEVWLDAEFLAAFRAEWAESGADVLTAAYRVQGMRNWPERLDAAAVLLTLLPGLAVLRAVGAIGFTLGACTAVRRGDVAVVGGWPAFGGVLAEDNRLGAALAAAGRTIRLSARLVSIESDLMGWRAWWRHQRRVAVTYRLANPAGFAGSIVTHGEVWALLLAVVDGPGGVGWLAAHILVRTLVAWRMGKRLGFSIAGLLPALVGASVAATGCWVASWFTASLWWGGREWRVGMWPESSPEREFDCPKEAVPP